jgi:hypothetical protein
LRNGKFLLFCKQGNKQESFASSHKSGGLVSVLASGHSALPKDARDLTGRKKGRKQKSIALLDLSWE